MLGYFDPNSPWPGELVISVLLDKEFSNQVFELPLKAKIVNLNPP